MKQVFEQYASSVIAALLALTLLTVFFGGKFFQGKDFSQVLGQMLEYSIRDNTKYSNEAYEDYMNDAAPKITRKDCGGVRKNESVMLENYFEAKSYKGEILPVYLKCAWRLDGEEVDLGVASDRRQICVPESGVYWMQIYAIDDNQKKTSVITKLLVNER